jgi:uncharacterized protein YbaA (DUF1428 family)
MRYVEGFVLPVPKKNLAEYRRLARKVGRIFREHGAIGLHEYVADDVKVGKWTSFPRSVKLKSGETVIFAWIEFKSRAQRDRINARVIEDPRLAKMMRAKPPFDGKRMIHGGFRLLIEV